MPLVLLCLVLLLAGLAENLLHSRRIRRIPVRIHVNGTRGKSTTTRLIAAGLRAGGYRVVAKTTGTAPRLIAEDGTEQPIRRRGRPNISEQLHLVKAACDRGAEALVLECMALRPENQWISEHRMIRATIGVITNVREDHLDLMGPTITEAAEALCLTIPRGGHLVTAEGRFLAMFEARARDLGTAVHWVDGAKVPEGYVESLPYLSFKENVACALSVCELAGVERETALRGMLDARADPGATRAFRLTGRAGGHVLVDAFAANDAASTAMVWERWRAAGSPHCLPIIAVMNNRADRPTRLAALSALLAHDIRPDQVILTGQGGRLAARHLRRHGLDGARIHDLTARHEPLLVLETADRLAPAGAVLLGVGNARGVGKALVDHFARNGSPVWHGEIAR